MRQIQVGDVTETVVERSDYPPERLREVLGPETVAVLGYGVQGRGQSLNMKDNGVRVIIGLRDKGRELQAEALDRAEALRPVVAEPASLSHRGLAKALNDRGIKTAQGGAWSAVQVIRVRKRLGF